jgi:hypothetical protein
MSPLNKDATSHLAEQFAEIYQMAQEDYRDLLTALRDESTDLSEFTARANALADGLIKLKRIRVQLRHERDELDQLNRNDSNL